MADYAPAVARIRYLAGLSTTPQRTPRTITDDESTPTTNRRIRAARMALLGE